MANQLNDNVYTTCFTPREYQAELLEAAKQRNIIICLGTASTKAFISIKLVQELANDLRNNGKTSVHLTNEQNIPAMATCLKYLTDLQIEKYECIRTISDKTAQVIVTTPTVFKHMIDNCHVDLHNVNLLIIDECHRAVEDQAMRDIMINYGLLNENQRPRVLGLASSLFQAGGSVSTLEASIERLEEILHSKAETASDIVTLLRYSHKPHEMIVQCARHIPSSLSDLLREYIVRGQNFLEDHRYDPYEMYDDEFQEDLQKIPDPKIDPKLAFDEFLISLDTLGPWCADKAALVLLIRIEKLKVKTPYERHFLLLCMSASILIQIRCLCNDFFDTYSELERVIKFSSPKIKRLIELFRQLKPEIPTSVENGSNSQVEQNPVSTSEKQVSDGDVVNGNGTNGGIANGNGTNGTGINGNGTNDAWLRNGRDLSISNLNEHESEHTDRKPVEKVCDNSDNLVEENACDNSECNVVLYRPNVEKTRFTTTHDVRNKYDRGRGGRRAMKTPRKTFNNYNANGDSLCGIIFVQTRLTARVLHFLLCELSRHDPELAYISVQYTVDKVGEALTDVREMEIEHRNQEEVLKRFRMHECNLLIATAILEEGIDVPRCNVVVHFDRPQSYRSYVHCKGRARVSGAYHVFIINEESIEDFVEQLAEYYEIEKILLRKCANKEPPISEEEHADEFTNKVMTYQAKSSSEGASVNLSTAIALLNRYCARLPSDTFTRLTPVWHIERNKDLFQCTVRLPINSPLKQAIIGPLMSTKVLSRRMTALKACKALHEAGELDDNLMPIGKEGFRASEPDWDNFPLDGEDEILARDSTEPRPGTTKRRQYYDKKIAETLVNCRPLVGQPAYLYHIEMILTCPLPEEQNTRGRKIYPPEESPQGFGILTVKRIPKICSFPIFTRSGEVGVQLELSKSRVVLDENQLAKICSFLNYMFTSVLRLQKYLMMYDPTASENSYFIVPTFRNSDNNISVDWEFLNRIHVSRDLRPNIIPEEDRKLFKFESTKYQDAVVMPWYRNQDQPQYFYVAEICYQLSPQSSFPGSDYNTFEEYYFEKYNIEIQNSNQPLLDVDHTSARLNFLTPRYVNRKGVALPTSSEETKRAKRENLEQKQILVPELCTVHPFPASLWRKAVCLPCILYRINALLLADEIRIQVARDLGLGQIDLPSEFEWPQLDFGWSLAAVLKKSNEAKQAIVPVNVAVVQETMDGDQSESETCMELVPAVNENSGAERKDRSWLEIGTWSNEMAQSCLNGEDDDEMDNRPIRYGSPTSMLQTYHSYSDEFDDSNSDDSLSSNLDNSDDYQSGLRIEFKGDNTAEAIEEDPPEALQANPNLLRITGPISAAENTWNMEVGDELNIDGHVEKFTAAIREHMEKIKSSILFIDVGIPIVIDRTLSKLKTSFPAVPNHTNELIKIESLENNVYTETVESTMYCCSDFDDIPPTVLTFSFDEQPPLVEHPGPSPSIILQALTMSNANDGINLERLETIGDSFLKYAITTYLYCTYENVHEGKLSHLRSKQVSNLNLYRLGRRKSFGESMIATKFEPHDNWLPPCYYVPPELEQALIDGNVPTNHWGQDMKDMTSEELCNLMREHVQPQIVVDPITQIPQPCIIPYNLLTQQSIPDKSIADCVEALIGSYLIECGPRGALLFMAWLGIRVLPLKERFILNGRENLTRPVGSLPEETKADNSRVQVVYGTLRAPRSPLLRHVPAPEDELARLLDGYETFERSINYRFRDRSYLLQALTHASYSPNRLTDCYQRLEFLGDAVLDYLITRHLYEDSRQHSPGALTDLRSALVNNTIFASLAVRYGFHKFFRHLSPGLHEVVDRFVRIQEANGHLISEECYLINDDKDDECGEAEDVEVPKALGDVFESVAGAIFLDSGMSLDAVWKVYYRMMRPEIELFSTHVPKSPIRELLELEPETAKFGKPEKLADGRRVRVSVDVFGKGVFKGIGRNYRIAKCTAAKCALKQLKKYGALVKKS